MSIIWIVAGVGLMYFMMIRPQKKQQKERTTMIEALKKGDRVVTVGGIHGIIRAIKDDRITLEIASEIYVQFTKAAIGNVIRNDAKGETIPDPAMIDAEDEVELEAEIDADDADYEIEQDEDEDIEQDS